MAKRRSEVISELKAAAHDITNMLDSLTGRMGQMDLGKLLNAKALTSELTELQGVLRKTYNEHERVIHLLEEADKKTKERLRLTGKELAALKKKGEQDSKDGKALVERINQLKKQQVELKKNKLEEIDSQKFSKKRIQLQELSLKMGGKMFRMLKIAADMYMVGLRQLEQVHERVFEWQTMLQKSLGTLSIRFGTTTQEVVKMRDEGLKQLLDTNGLGGLGLSLDEIVSQLADFNEALVFTNKISQSAASEMIKFGLGVGISAREAGELARAFILSGKSAGEVKSFMKSLSVEARKAGVSSASLAKQFQGAGRALFELSGPKAREQLVKTAGFLAKMGSGLDKIAGFVNMSDTFDQTAESMAKLNTVFGTHINALDVFSEREPQKRLEIIMEQMKAQGMGVEMSRQERKLLADTLQIDLQTLDAMLTRSKMTEEQLEQEKRREELAEKQAKAADAYEKSLFRSKQVLVAEQQIAAHINNSLTKQMAPFYDAFAEGGGLAKGAGMFDSYTQKWVKAINTISEKLSKQGMGSSLQAIGKMFGKIWDKVIDFVSGDAVASFVTGLVGAFEIVTDLIGVAAEVVFPVLKLAFGLVGKVLELITSTWKILKAIPAALGSFVGTLAGGGSISEALGSTAQTDEFMQAANYRSGLAGKATSPQVSGAVVEGLAAGGPVEQGKYYLVGERGPELFVSSTPGTIVPNNGPSTSASPPAIPANVTVQVVLDGEVIQERMYRTSLRSNQ